jgi:hypothetical protein
VFKNLIQNEFTVLYKSQQTFNLLSVSFFLLILGQNFRFLRIFHFFIESAIEIFIAIFSIKSASVGVKFFSHQISSENVFGIFFNEINSGFFFQIVYNAFSTQIFFEIDFFMIYS